MYKKRNAWHTTNQKRIFFYQIKWKYKACPRIVVSINKEHLSFIHDVADANNKFTINKVFCN
jgi:hypothetical protein